MGVVGLRPEERKVIIDHEEKLLVATRMIEYGGSFVKALGAALMKADMINTLKIRVAFSEYWDEYKFLFEKMKGQNDD